MKSKLILNSLAVSAVVALAAISSADSFSVLEAGTWTKSGFNVSSSTSLLPIFGMLENSTVVGLIGNAQLSIVEAGAPTNLGTAFTGTLTVDAGTGYTGDVVFSVSGKIYKGATESLAGSGTLTSATGSFKHYVTGNTNFSYQLLSPIQLSVGNISANFQAVPEPCSLAVMGVGIAGLLIRRAAWLKFRVFQLPE